MTAVAERGSDRLIAAERRAERIRLTATSFMEARDKMSSLLVEAQREADHETMGYRSWPEYIAALFSDTPLMRLSRDERKVIVADLAEQGMSSRAIAPVVGASKSTVAADIESVQDRTDAPRTVKSIDGIERTFTPRPTPESVAVPVDHNTGEIAEERKPKRRPLPDQYRDAILDLTKAADRLAALSTDDRFPTNRPTLAAIYRSDLDRTIATITETAHILQEN